MPGRYLKESICTSPDIEKLSWQEEVLFYRLLVQCDDFGRFEADPALVRAACFPRRISKVREMHVAGWLAEMANAGLIQRYEVAGRPYLQMLAWDKHQRRRATASRYPDPPPVRHPLTDDRELRTTASGSESSETGQTDQARADVGHSHADDGQPLTDAHDLDLGIDLEPRISTSEKERPTHTFTKYLDRFHNSERSFRGVTAERLLEIAQEEGIDAETAGKLLADVWEWWQTTTPSKRWKIPTRGWRGWCRREVKFAKEAAAKAALNGQVAPAPPPLLTTEEREARKQAEWAELEKVTASFDVGKEIP